MGTAHYHLLLVVGVSLIQGICQFEIRHRIPIVFAFAWAYVTVILFVYATDQMKKRMKAEKNNWNSQKSVSVFQSLIQDNEFNEFNKNYEFDGTDLEYELLFILGTLIALSRKTLQNHFKKSVSNKFIVILLLFKVSQVLL